MVYLKNNIPGSTTPPDTNGNSRAFNYKIGNFGKYFVKGLLDDPLNPYKAYLFTTDNNLNSGTFGVFKMDFTPATLKYVYTILSMSSGSSFSVNCIVRTSLTNENDFYFGGKTQSLTDGTNTQTFPTGYGYVMTGKTSDSTKNCFSFASGYSLSL